MTALDTVLDSLPTRYAGPGGAAAVVKEGKVIARHAWGFADVARRVAFTPQTLALICSITKQFTCGLVLDQVGDIARLDEAVARSLPNLPTPPRAIDLANNQSGLRDYWATAMLCGSLPEAPFGEADADRLIARTRSLHFAPGTRYSYCNQNFRLLGQMVQQHAGVPLAELLRQRLFDRAGMETAQLSPDTANVAGGAVGYEGNVEAGFRPAVNRIVWTGDAGIAASLDDMIAWERFVDATRDDEDGLYRRLSAAPTFRDGTPAHYGLGLSRATLLGRSVTCHGGGLRGWRSFRCHMASERLSAVVLFNHMADPRGAVLDMLGALLGTPDTEPVERGPAWTGRYLEPETGLAVRVDPLPDHQVKLRFAAGADTLTPTGPDSAASGGVRLRRGPDGVTMTRDMDGLATALHSITGDAGPPPLGTFHCAELDSRLTVVSAGGAFYAACSGDLGTGEMQQLQPFGPDLWLMPCQRALDHAAPGDWTLKIHRHAETISHLQVGCWLARDLTYLPVSAGA